MVAFGPEICRDFGRGVTKEWLETNGLGGYASSTIVGANTRRYHGLFIAALRPPTQRTLLLSKLEDTLAVRDVEYDLSCNQYPGAIHPQGFQHLRAFRLDPFPRFVYEVDDATRLEKTVAMCRGRNLVIVRYRVLASLGTVSFIVRPIVNCRDYHHLMRKNADFDTSAGVSGARDTVSMRPYAGVPTFHIRFPGAYFEPWGDWYLNFEYLKEEARGLDFREDQYSPGFFTCDCQQGESRYVVAGTEPRTWTRRRWWKPSRGGARAWCRAGRRPPKNCERSCQQPIILWSRGRRMAAGTRRRAYWRDTIGSRSGGEMP